ncbi:MAG: hypothetical protein CMK74_00640 [Pseudomonadales bacterium]|nr:hypothetical protein [Pseudomonadales bacterium]
MKRALLRLTAVATFCLIISLTLSPLALWAQDTKKAEPKKEAVTKAEPKKEEAKPAPVAKEDVKPATKEAEPVAAAPVKASEEQAWWQALLMPILSALGLALAAFLGTGIRKIALLIEKKWEVDIPDSMENLLTAQARRLLAYAEEKAEDKLLNKDGTKTPGAEKIKTVVDELESFTSGMGWDKAWQRDKLEKLAEGVLHLERSGNEGIGTTDGNRKVKLDEKKATPPA